MAEDNQLSVNLDEIDRLVHEPARLLIMAYLYVVESGDYPFLMNHTGMTWGNLSSHITKLEKGGYIEVEKTFKGKKPYTMMALTESGRSALQTYKLNMQALLDDLPG